MAYYVSSVQTVGRSQVFHEGTTLETRIRSEVMRNVPLISTVKLCLCMLATKRLIQIFPACMPSAILLRRRQIIGPKAGREY
jgi:hypothetical protein